jgi:hypothetical protein
MDAEFDFLTKYGLHNLQKGFGGLHSEMKGA